MVSLAARNEELGTNLICMGSKNNLQVLGIELMSLQPDILFLGTVCRLYV
jgi:hypothetical protein